ncbi:MAG TPA: hypothetical protein VFA94_13505 [Acidimicrobiales bacterium]|nr:hypothetical protein [Acidimicrobiales bacterium]
MSGSDEDVDATRAVFESASFDGVAGVVAHGLLNTMTVISGAAEILRTEWEHISSSRRHELFQLIELHAAEASEALGSIARGLPTEALATLDELSHRRDAPLPDPPIRLRRRRSD